jgi:hypothetical protein
VAAKALNKMGKKKNERDKKSDKPEKEEMRRILPARATERTLISLRRNASECKHTNQTTHRADHGRDFPERAVVERGSVGSRAEIHNTSGSLMKNKMEGRDDN